MKELAPLERSTRVGATHVTRAPPSMVIPIYASARTYVRACGVRAVPLSGLWGPAPLPGSAEKVGPQQTSHRPPPAPRCLRQRPPRSPLQIWRGSRLAVQGDCSSIMTTADCHGAEEAAAALCVTIGFNVASVDCVGWKEEGGGGPTPGCVRAMIGINVRPSVTSPCWKVHSAV